MTTNKTFELLVDKVDGNLSAEELQQVNNLIAKDPSAVHELAQLQHTISGIREAGIYERVTAIGKSFYDAEIREQGPVVSMAFVRKLMKVAAVILMVGVAATIFKFTAVTDEQTFEKYHSTYQLNTARAQNTTDEMEAAYRNRDWQGVLNVAATNADINNKVLFLTAMAQMELKQYGDAATRLQQIQERSKVGTDTYFKDEADYYLAMSYLAMKQAERAIPLLQSIKADKQHLFNIRVQKMNLDLRILQLKH
jgi:hypothetical protein